MSIEIGTGVLQNDNAFFGELRSTLDGSGIESKRKKHSHLQSLGCFKRPKLEVYVLAWIIASMATF